MSQFHIRKEFFGATVFDIKRLSYFFIDSSQLSTLNEFWEVTHGESILKGSGSRARSEHDISNGKFLWMLNSLDSGNTLNIQNSLAPYPADSLSAPIRIYLEISRRCNAHCNYCLNNSGTISSDELSTAELHKVIENFGREGIFEVRLTGGEPTLHPDFFKLALSVKSNKMALSTNSNLLVTTNVLKRLIAVQPNLLITSLDAAKDPHTQNRGDGYDLIVKNIHSLRRENVPLRMNCMLNRLTLPYIEKFIDEFAPLGCGFCFILARPVGRGERGFNPPPLSDLIPVVNMIENKKREYPDVYFSTSFHVVMDKELTIDNMNLTGCNAIQKSFNVNSDGAVLPCAFLYELSPNDFTLGNIRDYDFSALRIWRDSKLLRKLRQRSSQCNLRCIACPRFKEDCLGTCVFMELYSEHSGLHDPYCKQGVEDKLINAGNRRIQSEKDSTV